MNRKLKMRLVLPLIVLPFLTLIFWILGGGSGSAQTTIATAPAGLILDLPNAKLKDDANIDKLAYYNQAEADSVKIKDEIKKDPYYQEAMEVEDPHVKLVNDKLAALQQVMQPNREEGMTATRQPVRPITSPVSADQVERMERLLNRRPDDEPEADPEMDQLNGLLDKALALQHPEQVPTPMSHPSTMNDDYILVSTTAASDTLQPGFYSLTTPPDTTRGGSSFLAAVLGTQVLVNGSVVRLQVLQNLFIGNEQIPVGSLLFGIANLQDERLQIMVSSIRCGVRLIPVRLQVYDLDGLPGIYIPGAIGRETMKQQLNSPFSSTGLIAADPSLAAQAATMGMETVKGLFSRKVKLVRCTVRNGYQILLQNKSLKK